MPSLLDIVSSVKFDEASHEVIEENALRVLRENPRLKSERGLQGYSVIHVAALNGFTRLIRELHRLEVDVDTRTPQGLTPAAFAAMGGEDGSLRVLVDELGASLTQLDSEGSNLLDVALSAHASEKVNCFKVIEYLVSNGVKPDKTSMEDLLKVGLLFCQENNHAGLVSLYMSGADIPYVIDKSTGFHVFLLNAIRSLSAETIDVLNSNLALPLRADMLGVTMGLSTVDRTEEEDVYVKSNPIDVLILSLPVENVFIAPVRYLVGQPPLSDSALSAEVQLRAKSDAEALFLALGLTPNVTLRFDDDSRKFYVDKLFHGGPTLKFDINGDCTNKDELFEKLRRSLDVLMRKGFGLDFPEERRKELASHLLKCPDEIIDFIRDKGFLFKECDLEQAIESASPHVVMGIIAMLNSVEEGNEEARMKLDGYKLAVRSSNNYKIQDHKDELITAIDHLYPRPTVAASTAPTYTRME